MRVAPGEKVCVVGRKGAGKSSLLLSIVRLIQPEYGSIIIDGVDVNSLSLHDLRRSISVVPQGPHLFTGSLQYNLDPTGSFNTLDILDVLELVGLVETFKDRGGLLMEIEENGSNLSDGEKTLIGIARALLRRSKIVLIDEVTPNTDAETERKIQNLLNGILKDATVMRVAHRVETVMNCDRVVVLSKGKVVEFDTPSALMGVPDSFFRRMVEEHQQRKGMERSEA
jgi:ABC-type multidrug transport system fused ATPase/permease subunit